jgi:membrane-bound serine protease (ClpP class)
MILYALLLALLGLCLIFIEFFMPGGILAVLGAISIISGVLLLGLMGPGWGFAFGYLTVCVPLIVVTCYFAIHRIKRSGKKDSFYLSRDQEGYVSASLDPQLIGKKGIATSDLKPSGHITVDGVPYQAVSERGYITQGSEVDVIATKSAYLIVKPSKE